MIHIITFDKDYKQDIYRMEREWIPPTLLGFLTAYLKEILNVYLLVVKNVYGVQRYSNPKHRRALSL
jgi:hypothetical protein